MSIRVLQITRQHKWYSSTTKYHRPWRQTLKSASTTRFVHPSLSVTSRTYSLFFTCCVIREKNLQSFGPFTRHLPSLLCLFGFARHLWFQKRFLKDLSFTVTGNIFVEKVTLKLCGGNSFVVSNTMDSKRAYVFLEVFCLV